MVEVFPEVGLKFVSPFGKGLGADQAKVALAVVDVIVTACVFPWLQIVCGTMENAEVGLGKTVT